MNDLHASQGKRRTLAARGCGNHLLTKYLNRQDNSGTVVVSRDPHSRSRLLKQLDEALRTLGAQSVLISDLVAARVGLNSTDLECLDLLVLAGPTTAGRLAKHTGLTTGATTAVIDRLIMRMAGELNVTSLVVTHDMKSAYRIADRVAMLYRGRIRYVGTPAEIQQVEDPVVKGFVEGLPELAQEAA